MVEVVIFAVLGFCLIFVGILMAAVEARACEYERNGFGPWLVFAGLVLLFTAGAAAVFP